MSDSRRTWRWLVPVLLGASGFLALQGLFTLTWEDWFEPAEIPQPWFMGSRRSLLVTQTVLAVVAFGLGSGRSSGWRQRFSGAGLLALGAVAGMATVFAWIGPDKLMLGSTRLWPVALVSGALLLAPAIALGTLMAGLLQGVDRWPRT